LSDGERDEAEVLTRHAVRIFLRLRDDPDNATILLARDAFLARGPAERAAWDRAKRAASAVRDGRAKGKGPARMLLLALVVGTMLAAAASHRPLRMALAADAWTAQVPSSLVLASGDAVHLDAASAIVDETGTAAGAARRVRLLEGAAFFDVAATGTRFEVIAGPALIEVVGTAFEVTQAGDAVRVAVAEGEVVVSFADTTVTLQANEQARFAQNGSHRVDAVEMRSIAAWRENRLVTDGMEFADAVRIIERRLPGRVAIMGTGAPLGRVTGGLDLNDPEQALRALAALRGGRVVSIVPGVFMLFPGD